MNVKVEKLIVYWEEKNVTNLSGEKIIWSFGASRFAIFKEKFYYYCVLYVICYSLLLHNHVGGHQAMF